MEINQSIKIRNYKCFGPEEQGFDRILPINIIIGKNNSGKSSLIELIEFLIDTNSILMKKGRQNTLPEVIITKTVDTEIFAFPSNTSGGSIQGNHFDYAKRNLEGKQYSYKYLGTGEPNTRIHPNKVLLDQESLLPQNVSGSYLQSFTNRIDLPFKGKTFRRISAERDIKPESDVSQYLSRTFDFEPNGSGISQLIQVIINKEDFDSNLIEIYLLRDLNKVLYPEIKFDRILVQRDSENLWEIYFYQNNTRIALSSMGSGVKTLLQVLLNLLVIPIHHKKRKVDYVFAFEELENNLHPAILRRLFSYIATYAIENSVYFFITTHSNVVIDIFGTNPNAQLIHVFKDGTDSKSVTILSHNKTKEVLKDLDIRASDLLQSNGIVWVEGPSDRVYLNKWLSILSPELIEGLHYSIMFYGGRLLANTTLDPEWIRKDIIPLLKINTNAFIIIDSDKKSPSSPVNKTKQRVQNEIGIDNCWITKGREIENYLSERLLNKWVFTDYNIKANIIQSKTKKIETILKDANLKIDYKKDKTGFSTAISTYIEESDLDILDLRGKLNTPIEKIKKWNSLPI